MTERLVIDAEVFFTSSVFCVAYARDADGLEYAIARRFVGQEVFDALAEGDRVVLEAERIGEASTKVHRVHRGA